ncbi:MAG: sulfate ABC transporter substrate-binding protein [Archangium sp.]|nr:sulfate ABC transporter substrate-binding protein [Archangium sp.]MDP3151557.1 sulfate ABC transporter substrate-binding protein [Archangium sp.]MDP3572144.1 sulfate ABC transporter substrate-binding protein [Archangium sp.]
MRALALLPLLLLAACSKESTVTLLNASYDPTRELYEEVNRAFAKRWLEKTGQTVVINQSHGGSGKQARAVIDGLEADLVTLALGWDIDAVASKGKLLPENWATRLPRNSAPFASTIVFVVRKGNPRGIHDWEDLAKPGVQVITPNPKTSGGARWNYLAAYGAAQRKPGGDDAQAKQLMAGLFANVPVLDAGARGSTTTFAERGLGDVLIAWENEALLLLNGASKDTFEVVVPSLSILAETPVALVDQVVDRRGTRTVAEAYLKFLYSDEGQALASKHGFRPTGVATLEPKFAKVSTFTIAEGFGGWATAQRVHFDDRGLFDQLYAVKK